MNWSGVRWFGCLLGVVVALIGGVAQGPVATVADEEDERQFSAYVLEGTCGVIKPQPVAELGELALDHEAGRALAEDVEPEPDAVYGGERNIPPTLDALLTSEHVVAVREDLDGASPVVACAEISGDDGDELDLHLEAYGDTGVEGRVRLETITRVEASTDVSIGVWNAAPDAPASQDREMPEAPDFELELFNGDTVRMSDYRGKTVVMIMWASWCPYCNAEFPMYQELWEKNRDNNVVFLGVGLKNDDQDAAEDFIEKHGVTFPVGRDTEGGDALRGEIESTVGVPGTPALFIITPDGYVYGAQFGVIEKGSLQDAIDDASTYRDGE